MTDIPALIARLEAAEGPSRELDAEVAFVCGALRWTPRGIYERGREYPVVGAPEDWPYDHDRAVGAARGNFLMKYTASIDAALTLVPEGWWVKAEICRNAGAEYEVCHAFLSRDADTVGRDLEDDEPLDVEAINRPSLAIALCIAALKARSHA